MIGDRCSGFYRSVANPLAYWKIVAFVHDDGRQSATAYLIDHDVDLTDHTLLFGAFKTYQRSVRAIKGVTNLYSGMARTFDSLSNKETATGETIRRLITTSRDRIA